MKIRKRLLAVYLVGTMSWGIPVVNAASELPAGERNAWQMKLLKQPSEAQLALESQGRVQIYSELSENTVNLVMDTQFERIENMMFIKTVVTKENGEQEIDDDGCDD